MSISKRPPAREDAVAYLKSVRELFNTIAPEASPEELHVLETLYSTFAMHALTKAPMQSTRERRAAIKGLLDLCPGAVDTTSSGSKPSALARFFGRRTGHA